MTTTLPLDGERAKEASIKELLQGVPADARLIYEHSPTHSQSIPVGVHAARAVARITELENQLADMTDDYLRRHREVCELKFGSAARSKPEGAEKNQDHLAACAGGGVQVPLTEAKIFDIADDFKSTYTFGGTTYDRFDETGFARAIEAEHRIVEPARGDVLACGQIKKDVSAIGKGEADHG